MSNTTADLRRKIDGAGDLQSVVRTMKAVAASSIGQYEKSVSALGDYYHAIEPVSYTHLDVYKRQLQSSSKMATPGIVGERHYLLAQKIRETLATYENLKDIIAMLGLEQLAPEDRQVVNRARRLERFLTQPFFATEQFSGCLLYTSRCV